MPSWNVSHRGHGGGRHARGRHKPGLPGGCNDCILGLGGNDIIEGRTGDDFIVGGEGQDNLSGGNGADQIFGDDGDDTIAGGNDDVILDSRGPATITPGAGTDACSAPGCDLPAAANCVVSSDCPSGQRCVGGACVHCHADSECDDGSICTGEMCVPVLGCQDAPDALAGVPIGTTCEVGTGACLRAGDSVCDGTGGVVCNTVPGAPRPDEDCDMVDDDCDGRADDDYDEVPRPPGECGVGACMATGSWTCTPAGEVLDCVPGAPAPEACDGVDNDCDTRVDEVADLDDSDGDTLCDGPRIGRPTTGPGQTPDACPFQPDLAVIPGFDLVVGEMFVQHAGDPTPRPISNLQVRTGLGDSITDCTGTYAYLVPTGSPSINDDDMVLEFWFHAALRGTGGISSIVQVVDDLGIPWGLGSLHGGGLDEEGFRRTAPSHVEPPESSGRRTRRVDRIVLTTSEAELYRIAVLIADDYHDAHQTPVPGGTLSFMREAGVVGATTYVDYNFVRMSSEALESGVLETQWGREQTLFHESAHVFRHVLDGDSAHFVADVFRFSLSRCHTGREIAAEGYAFNEGWADYWAAARYDPGAVLSGALPLFNVAPPLTSTARNPVVRTIEDVAGTDEEPTTTDYCDTGVIGGRGLGLKESHVDFVEQMVRDRLLDISRTCLPGATPNEADSLMLFVLESNRGSIHSVFEFEQALLALGVCTGVPADGPPLRTEPPAECPDYYHDDGEHCSREGHIIRERSG